MSVRKRTLKIYKEITKAFAGYGIGEIPLIKQIYWFIFSLIRPTLVNVDGHKMFLDPKDALNLSIDGIWEPFETELVKKEIKKGDVVLDLGANIGYYDFCTACG